MKSFNINDVRIKFGDLEIGPEDWLSTDVQFDSWSAQTERPTMCEWCRSHPRRYGGDARCWRCGHEHGCQVTGGTSRPGEVGTHGFTLMQTAMCFDGVIPFTGGQHYRLHLGRVA